MPNWKYLLIDDYANDVTRIVTGSDDTRVAAAAVLDGNFTVIDVAAGKVLYAAETGGVDSVSVIHDMDIPVQDLFVADDEGNVKMVIVGPDEDQEDEPDEDEEDDTNADDKVSKN